MKFSFENLGAISHGDIELADLTVLCGKNNTGKTYLTYGLYGFLRNHRQFIDLPIISHHLIQRRSPFEIDVEDDLPARSEVVQDAVDKYVRTLGSVLAAPPERFSNTRMRLELKNNDSDLINLAYSRTFNLSARKAYLTVEKAKGDRKIRVSLSTTDDIHIPLSSLQRILSDELKSILIHNAFPQVFIVSTERTGAVAFRGELNLSKNRLLEAAQQIKPDEVTSPGQLLQMLQSSSYPLPVRDNVDFVNSLSTITSQKSFLQTESPGIIEDFADLIGGEYRVDRQGELSFQPISSKATKLRMGESSSAVRSLVMLGFYLRHVAAKGDLLMIDEPELNLHPSNQRRLAKLITRIVNSGIRVFLTTHSDYIVRELNNLIILKGLGDKGLEIKQSHGYRDDELLDSSGFRLYTLQKGRFKSPTDNRKPKTDKVQITREEVTQRDGINSTTFDDTISEMNLLHSELVAADEYTLDADQ